MKFSIFFGIVASTLFFVASPLLGQQPKGTNYSGPITLEKAIKDAPAEESELSLPIDQAAVIANKTNQDPTLAELVAQLQSLRSEVQTLQDKLASQKELNDQLQKQLSDLSSQMEVLARGGSGSDSGSPSFVRSIQDDPKLRGDFQKVVQGKIIFDNQTGIAQRVFINGAEWEVIAGRSSMYVPFGQVTIHTRAASGGPLNAYNLDDWKSEGEQFVLHVPLLEAPILAK